MLPKAHGGEWIMDTLIELPGFKHQGLRGDNSEGETPDQPAKTLYLPPSSQLDLNLAKSIRV